VQLGFGRGIRCLSSELCHGYQTKVQNGELQNDEAQLRCLGRLQVLGDQLRQFEREMDSYVLLRDEWVARRDAAVQLEVQRLKEEQDKAEKEESSGFGAGFLGKLLRDRKGSKQRKRRGDSTERAERARLEKAKQHVESTMEPRPQRPEAPQGLYIYGGVGAGKSMLMDTFYASVDISRKRRSHFHDFMVKVHEGLHVMDAAARESGQVMQDPIGALAQEMAGGLDGVGLLCFDEFQCNDIFTAVVLNKLFTQLLQSGTTIVSTSNRRPKDLNSNLLSGPQALEFETFLGHLSQACEEWPLQTGLDYRRLTLEAETQVGAPSCQRYLYPLHAENIEKLDKEFQEACEGAAPSTLHLPVAFGRELQVPEAVPGVARFSFKELCDSPVGSADFTAVAQNFHTVFICGIPQLSISRRNEARRFITLVDELYNHHTVLYCTAEVPMEDLFEGTDDWSKQARLEQLEALQFETEVEGSKLRRDLMASGAVSPIAQSQGQHNGSLFTGEEERFTFDRALSRLIEMQSTVYRSKRKSTSAVPGLQAIPTIFPVASLRI